MQVHTVQQRAGRLRHCSVRGESTRRGEEEHCFPASWIKHLRFRSSRRRPRREEVSNCGRRKERAPLLAECDAVSGEEGRWHKGAKLPAGPVVGTPFRRARAIL